MGRYRKRPVEVDARQFTTDTMHDVLAWIREQGGTATEAAADNRPVLYIHTLEGNMQACPGDWIVQGVRGEFHPVRGDIFTDTYEPATAPLAAADRDGVLPAGFRSVVAIAVTCAACEYEFDEDESHTVHFDTVAQAQQVLRDHGWTVLADGRAICDSDEPDHHELRPGTPAPETGQ
ncbi:hypothetical protein ACW4TU_18615 [Streptomyces sp. QTS52]